MTRGRKRYLDHKEEARHVVHALIHEYNRHYRVPLRKVFIKDHKTRWGSCSERGNLNFNYRILFLPQELQAYVVVHELCHLVHFNHKAEFWQLVAQTVPAYKALRRAVRRIRIS